VGADGRDNGGKLSGKRKAGTDLGYRLWDVTERGRVARPAPPPRQALVRLVGRAN
jgi:hypothetical protein